MKYLRITALLLIFGPAFANANPQDSLQAAKLALQAEQWGQAIRLFEAAVEKDPGSGEGHFYLAQLYLRQGREQDTIEQFLKATELLPRQELVWSEYGKYLIQKQYPDEAERVYRRLTELNPANGGYWIQYGLGLYENGRTLEALEFYERGLSLQPQSARGYYLAGLASRSLGQIDRALEYFKKGLAIRPDYSEINYHVGDILLQRGEPSASLAYWERLSEHDARGWYGRGVAYLRLGDLEKAENALKEAVKFDNQNAQIHYQLGLLYDRLGKKDLSGQFFQRFRELEAQAREKRRVRDKKVIIR